MKMPKMTDINKFIKKKIGILLMAGTFAVFDIFIRLFVGAVLLDGVWGIIMPIIFDALWIALFVFLCLSLPKIVGKILYIILVVFFAVWTFANYIYHCVFKQFLWIADIIMAGEGSNYLDIVFDYAPWWSIIIVIGLLVCVSIAALKLAPFGLDKRFLVIPIISVLGIIGLDKIFLQIAQNELNNGRWEIWQRPALIYNEYRDSKKSLYTSGLYQYTAKSIAKLFEINNTDIEAETAFAQNYFKKNIPDNEMTGLLEGKNVIFVLMESVDDFLISEEYTPEIKRMMENGINFTNHYTPNIGAGYTFNSEFAANTGFFCPTNSSSASIYTKNSYPQTIANRLKAQGYSTSAVHFNSKQFYNRDAMYKKWGYDEYYCLMNYLPITEAVIDSNAIKSEKVSDVIVPDSKFMTYFITYSAHLPYNKVDNKLKGIKEYYPELVDNHENEELSNLRLLARDTDEFFKLLNEKLEEKGIAEDTVIVAYTDHYAYGLNDKELLKSESIAAGSEILEKTPFFIYCKGMEPASVTKVTSSIDILPTLENLLGLEKNPNVLGNDAFSDEGGLVYFADGRWFDGKTYYNPSEKYDTDFSDVNKHINDLRRINDFVIEYDYFKQN